MKGAVVGFGTIAQGHMRGYMEARDLSIEAVVDICRARRQFASEQFGLRAYADLESLLEAERVDFIDICTPPSSHADYVLAALDRDIPALCEKPFFVPGVQAYDEFVSKILDAQVVVYPCSNYKFAPAFSIAREIVSSGALGDIISVRIRILRSGHALGVREWRPEWRREPALSCGGILRDHGPHAIYLATSLSGLAPVSVSCILGSMRSDRWSDTEDTALLRVQCEGGAEIEVSLSWASKYRDSYYVISGARNSITVHNDEVLFTNSGAPERVTTFSNFDDASHSAWFAMMFDHFSALVDDPAGAHDTIRFLMEEAALTSRVIDGGYASAQIGGAWTLLDTHPVPLMSGSAP